MQNLFDLPSSRFQDMIEKLPQDWLNYQGIAGKTSFVLHKFVIKVSLVIKKKKTFDRKYFMIENGTQVRTYRQANQDIKSLNKFHEDSVIPSWLYFSTWYLLPSKMFLFYLFV